MGAISFAYRFGLWQAICVVEPKLDPNERRNCRQRRYHGRTCLHDFRMTGARTHTAGVSCVAQWMPPPISTRGSTFNVTIFRAGY